MARTSNPNSATSQFFINVRDNHSLDFGIRGAGYAVFGQVIEGMDVVDRIRTTSTTRRGEHQNTPTRPVIIQRAYAVAAEPPGVPEEDSEETAGEEAPPSEAGEGEDKGPEP